MAPSSIYLLISIASLACSLLVVPSSPQCADQCGNVLSSTSGAEISCFDSDYASSTYGATFKACIACELSSTYVDPTSSNTDLQWGLYNLRFALSWCLFGFDNNTTLGSSPCLTQFSCGTLQAGIEYNSLDPNNQTAYAYCSDYIQAAVNIPKCSQCLAETGNEEYLSNFVTALDAACIQQPGPGSTISIQGSLFSSTSINITTPSATPISSYKASTGGFTLGDKIGIAVGGLLLILATTGCCIVCRGKRRRRRILAEKARRSGYGWESTHRAARSPELVGHGGSFFDSPSSQKILASGWGGQADSPQSANPEKTHFSPYVTQYSSPVSGTEGPSKGQEWPRAKKGGEKEEEGERIEMVGVGNPGVKSWRASAAPVLSHPGNGRSDYLGLTAEDAKKGHAL